MSHLSKELLPERHAHHAVPRMRTLPRVAVLSVLFALCLCASLLGACSSKSSQAASTGFSGRFAVDERQMFGSFTENIYVLIGEDGSVEVSYRGRHLFGTLVRDGSVFGSSTLYHIADVRLSMGTIEEGITVQMAVPDGYENGRFEGLWAIMYDDQRTDRTYQCSDVFLAYPDGTSVCSYLKNTNVFDGEWTIPEETNSTWRQIADNRFAFVNNESGFYKEVILPH